MKLSYLMIHALSGMILQSVSELQAAAADFGTARENIESVTTRIATAAGIDNFYTREMIFEVCELVAFNLLQCKEYCHRAIFNEIKRICVKYDK